MDTKNKSKLVLDANDNGAEELEGKLRWEDLMLARKEAVSGLLGQQYLLTELTKNYEELLAEDNDLNRAVDGLMKSYKDIGAELRTTMEKHVTFEGNKLVSFKEGVIDQEENESEYYDYIQIGGEYISAQEKIGNLSATAYLDIFTQLKVGKADLEALKQVGDDGKAIIKDAIEESVTDE